MAPWGGPGTLTHTLSPQTQLAPFVPCLCEDSTTQPAARVRKKLEMHSAPPYHPPSGSATPGQSGLLNSTYVHSFLSCFRGWLTTKQAEPPRSAFLRTWNIGGHSHAWPQMGHYFVTMRVPLGHYYITCDYVPRGPGAVLLRRCIRDLGLRQVDAFRRPTRRLRCDRRAKCLIV